MTNIKTILAKWGAQTRRMPADAATILERVTSATPRTPTLTQPHVWHIPRLAIGFAIFAVVAFAGQSYVSRQLVTADADESYQSTVPRSYSDIEFGTSGGLSAPSMGALEKSIAPLLPYYPQPYFQQNDTPITDTREILETSYSAHVKTRKVDELGSRLQTIVRGFGGRIDSASLNERYGSIAFALPANKLDALRGELKSLIWKRFLSESVYAENRLNEQRAIEDRTKTATDELDRVADQRVEIKKKYDAREASLTAQIRRLTTTLRTLTEQRATAATDDVRASIDAQIKTTDRDLRTTRSALTKMRVERDQALRNLDIEENTAKVRLDDTKRDEQTLAGRVATIRGTISLEQLSYTRIATTFIAGHWIALFFGLLAILAFRWMDRRPLIAN